jgi:hypothetical protein
VLVVLGIDVLRRLRGRQVHVHAHHHGDGLLHIHAHGHDGAPADHTHEHPAAMLPRALLVGTAHGLAGSAALVLLAVQGARSTAQALAYLALFGVGIDRRHVHAVARDLAAVPPGPRTPWAACIAGVEGALGVFTIALGSWIAIGVALGR